MADVAKSLRALQDEWESAEVQEGGGYYKPPAGTHQVKIKGATVEHSKKGRLQVKWQLAGLSKAIKGEKFNKFDGLENEENLSWLKTALSRLGIKLPENMKNLQKALDRADGLTVEIAVVESGQYTNIYFNRVIESIDSDDDDDDGDDDSGEEEEPTPKKKKAKEEEEEEEEPKPKKKKGKKAKEEEEDDDF